MKGALIASPSKNLAPHAVVTLFGVVDPLYPTTNVQTLEPDIPLKAGVPGAAWLQAILPLPTALQGAALINTNFGGQVVSLHNSAGQAFYRNVPPTRDGLGVNVYWDLRGVSAAATDWSVYCPAMSVPLAVGTLLLIESWTHLRVRWDWEWKDVFPRIEHLTGHGKRLQYWIPVRTRRYAAVAFDASQRNLLRALKQEAHGSIIPWTLVPDFEDDTVVLVQFLEEELPETYTFGRGRFDQGTASGVIDMPIAVEEVSNGVGL